ncbi:chorismate mutase [Eremococcus coleocola]|uniref:Chorismate mutase n=1 Tax=Eremococcus coleocola ACS-139-V-Col8 TaxID=908337 RepID=E4KQB3_9LACT|nr:chorismate mutase [Eremococcus coleocola]EFR30889.1 chorismate mutase [Eremococcus coleocola ACS-139-V-Col8]
MLEAERQRIDQIDQEIVALFEARMETVLQVAQYKLDHDLPVLDASREHLVIEKVRGKLNNPELAPYLTELYQTMMAQSRAYQSQWLDHQK